MALDLDQLGKSMLAAMATVLKTGWKHVKSYAAMEAKKLAQTLVSLTEMYAVKVLTKEDVEGILGMQRLASQHVLLAVKGMALIAVQDAINAALGAVRKTVNAAIRFPLL